MERSFLVLVNVEKDGTAHVDFIENETGDCCGYCTTVSEAMNNENIGKELASWILLTAEELNDMEENENA